MAWTNDFLLQSGVDCIDVKKKLKADFCKDGDLPRIINLENGLNKIGSMLFDMLPSVMQDKLLSGVDGCRCLFSIRAIYKTFELESSVCNEMQGSDKFPVTVTDVQPVVWPLVTTEVITLDHVTNQNALFTSSFTMDSPTQMPVSFNLVADDPELLDTTSDMVVQTQRIVQCSESSVSATVPDDSGMDQSSNIEQMTGELETISYQQIKVIEEPSMCMDIAENDVSPMRLSSSTPEQVASDLETICCQDFKDEVVLNMNNIKTGCQDFKDEVVLNMDNIKTGCQDFKDEVVLNMDNVNKTDISSCNDMTSKPKQKVEPPLQQLKIAPRNFTSSDSFNIESVCELRHSSSHEEEDTCCDDAKDKLGQDGYFEQPQPPGTPPAITGFRLVKSLESKLIQQMANHLGRGSFGSVFKAHDKDTGTLLAIKRVPFMKDGKDEVMKEVHIMNRLRHRNIITVLGSQVLEMECQIFLEWMAGGSVQELLSLYGPMSATVIQSYSEQVLSGIAYLHQWEILHCDVKGANIVVDSTGQVAKLCDFGLAVKMPLPEGTPERGTVPFMAPELFQGSCNSRGSDVWSVGCTMLQMATGNPPLSEFHHFGDDCVKFKICVMEFPIPSSLPLLLRKAIADCLQKDVTKRPTAHLLQCRLAMTYLEDMSASPYVHDY